MRHAGVTTSIRAPIRSFKIADAVTSIGLYRAVMGRYPDLNQVTHLTPQRRTQILQDWEANPDLPLTYTTLAEDQAFVTALNRKTGRRFFIPNESQVEYAIRGRLDGSGKITTTKYHFGDADAEVSNHAFVYDNPLTQGRVHAVHEIPAGQEANYTNSFGLKHAIGNVYVRSNDGVVRGGSFSSNVWYVASSFRGGGCAESRYDYISFRLAEDLPSSL